MENGAVASLGEDNFDGVGAAFRVMIFRQFLAQAPSLGPHYGIDTRVERRIFTEYLDCEYVFLQFARTSGD